MNVEQARFNMIEQQIRPAGVLDQAVLELLGIVRREDFVPAASRALAFSDIEIPLPDGQAMLAPRLEARLLQEARVQKHEKVLQIGAGSGFLTALLAHRAQSVIALERSAALVALAQDNLRRAGITNASVREGDGAGGLPAEAPFDLILLAGSVAQVPRTLLDQLKPGGRLLAVVGEQPVMRAQRHVRGDAGAHAEPEILFDTVVPRLAGFPQAPAFVF